MQEYHQTAQLCFLHDNCERICDSLSGVMVCFISTLALRLLFWHAGQGSIAEQLLVNPNPQCMDDELSLDDGHSGEPVLDMTKQSDRELTEMTPLDDCLAQLTSETAPSLRIPGSDGACSASRSCSWPVLRGDCPVCQRL